MKAIIVGGGQVGSCIANLLLEAGCQINVVERREAVLSKLAQELPTDSLTVGEGTDPATLEAAGISEADVFVAVTGADEINLVASTIAKFEFGVERVIARVNNPKNDWLFTISNGVDVKFNQAEIIAHLVVDEIDIHNMVTLMQLNRGRYSIIQIEVEPGSRAAGKTMQELALSEGVVIIAIHRGEELILPRGKVAVQPEDHILALANEEGQKEITNLFQHKQA